MSSPTGSPFAEVIQSLAGLHQEHHKALMDMRADQERRFCALVQNQREDRELLRSWMDREVRAGESPAAPAPPTHMPVQKMGPQDDPEAFLDLFEKTAVACGWPQTDWPVRLIPLLTGEAQLAAQQLPVQNLLVYDDLKRAILQRVGQSPEQHRQRFRSLELGENGRPFALAVAPPHEGYQRADHPLVSGITALQIQGDPQAGDTDDCSRLPLQEWGGGLQAGGLPGLSRAVGVCGEGGVVQRSLQREKDSGDSGK